MSSQNVAMGVARGCVLSSITLPPNQRSAVNNGLFDLKKAPPGRGFSNAADYFGLGAGWRTLLTFGNFYCAGSTALFCGK